MNNKLLLTGLGIVGLTLLFVLRGCNDRSQPNAEPREHLLPKSENVVEIPETFPPFYEAFHTDSLYQVTHIQWPLSQQSDGAPWTLSEWELHKPFDNSSGEFTRDLDNFAGMITETIRHKQGYFYLIRRFAEMDGEWRLIYYTVESIADTGEAEGE